MYKITKSLNAVKFEALYRKTAIVQYKRFQNYRHTMFPLYCCVKCADNHDYRTCSKSKTDRKSVTCILCGGVHPANNEKCQTYLEIFNK